MCVLDYAKYYESLSQAAPTTLDASDAEEDTEFETVENTEGSNVMEERQDLKRARFDGMGFPIYFYSCRMDGEEEEFEDVPLVSGKR